MKTAKFIWYVHIKFSSYKQMLNVLLRNVWIKKLKSVYTRCILLHGPNKLICRHGADFNSYCSSFEQLGTWASCFLSSPKLKARVRFFYHFLSGIRLYFFPSVWKPFTFSTSLESHGRFKPNLAERVLGWRGFKLVKMKVHVLFTGRWLRFT